MAILGSNGSSATALGPSDGVPLLVPCHGGDNDEFISVHRPAEASIAPELCRHGRKKALALATLLLGLFYVLGHRGYAVGKSTSSRHDPFRDGTGGTLHFNDLWLAAYEPLSTRIIGAVPLDPDDVRKTYNRTGRGVGCTNWQHIQIWINHVSSLAECEAKCDEYFSCKGFGIVPLHTAAGGCQVVGSEYSFKCALWSGACSGAPAACWDEYVANDGMWATTTFKIKAQSDDTIALMTSEGKYVSAQPDGMLRADASLIGESEKFYLKHRSSTTVSLRDFRGKYIRAARSGSVVANSTSIGESETISVIYKGGGRISLLSESGKYFALVTTTTTTTTVTTTTATTTSTRTLTTTTRTQTSSTATKTHTSTTTTRTDTSTTTTRTQTSSTVTMTKSSTTTTTTRTQTSSTVTMTKSSTTTTGTHTVTKTTTTNTATTRPQQAQIPLPHRSSTRIYDGDDLDVTATPGIDEVRATHGMVLLTSAFIPSGAWNNHINEIYAAVNMNMLNPYLTGVHILTETDCHDLQEVLAEHAKGMPDASEIVRQMHRKLTCANTEDGKQPTYADFFRYANETLSHRVVVFSNADVLFDESLGLVEQEPIIRQEHGYILSVTSPEHNGLYKKVFDQECDLPSRCAVGNWQGGGAWGQTWSGCSWDGYIFAPPLAPTMDIDHIDITMNTNGAENLAGFQLEVGANITLSNPCFHVRAWHWHCQGGKMHSTDNSVRADRPKWLLRRLGWPEHHTDAMTDVFPCWNCPGITLPEGAPDSKTGYCKKGTWLSFRKLPALRAHFRSEFVSPGVCCKHPKTCWQMNFQWLPHCVTAEDVDCVTWDAPDKHRYY